MIVEANDTQAPCSLKWFRLGTGQGTSPPNVSLPLGFHRAGGADEIETRKFLLSGLKFASPANKGMLYRVHLDRLATPAAITVVETKEYDGLDFLKVAWSATDQRIYAYGADKKLYQAPWAGFGQALPASFTEIANVTTWVTLKYYPRSLYCPDIGGVVVTVPGLGFGGRLYLSGTNWVRTRYPPAGPVPDPAVWTLSSVAPAIGTFSLSIHGNGSGAFDIVSLSDNGIVGSGTHGGSGVLQVPTPIVFFDQPGRPYQIRGSGLTNSRAFYPLHRYGVPSTNSTELSLRPIGVVPIGSYIGCNRNSASTQLKFGTPPVPNTTYWARLSIGVRDQNGDPVQDLGNGKFLLNGVAHLDFTFTTDPQTPLHFYRLLQVVPIADDPNLLDAVLLYQILVVDSTDVVDFTDVLVCGIQPAPGTWAGVGAAASSKSPAARAMAANLARPTKEELEKRARAARVWLLELQETKKQNGKLTELLRKLRRPSK